MNIKNRNKKYQLTFEHISTPLVKVRKSGNSLVVRIPAGLAKKHNINEGTKLFFTMHIQRKKFFGELEDDEEWVKMNKRERIMFEAWNEEKERDKEWE